MSRLGLRVLVNCALLLLAVALIAVVWLEPGREPPAEPEKLSDLDPTRVTRIRIQGPGRAAIELSRENSLWRIVSPISLPANENRVAALLGLAAARFHDAFRAEGNDLKEFGLESPTASVRLDDQEFLFGDTEPLNGWRYLLHNGEVHLITDAYYHHLLATPAAFVDPAPVGTGARLVAIDLGGVNLRLEQGRWRANSSGTAKAEEAGARLADAWRSAQASSVRPFDSALDWRQTIQIELNGEPEPLRFRVARLQHELVIGRPDWQVQYQFPLKAGVRLVELGE